MIDIKSMALDVFTAPIFILRNGEIVFANPACRKAFGLACEREVIGHHIIQRLSDLQPDGLQVRASLDSFNKDFHANGFAQRIWSVKRLDGSGHLVRANVVKIPSEEARYSIAVFEDMETFAAEHLLQASAVRALAENGIVKSVADRLAATAHVLNEGALSLSQSSDRAAIMLKEAMVAAEKTAASTLSISASSTDLSRYIETLMERMIASGSQARDAFSQATSFCETIAALSTAASRIGEITKLVSTFSSQTQLLALNATIEAARAGEAGRGFAVVAAEVKILATQSEKASQEVRDQTSAIRLMVEQAARTIADISSGFGTVQRGMDELAKDLDHQRTATHQIKRNVEDSAQAAEDLSGVVDGLFTLINENTAMSGHLLENSTKLQNEAESLQQEVREFSAVVL